MLPLNLPLVVEGQRIRTRAANAGDHEFLRTLHHTVYRDVVLRQFGKWDVADQDRWFEESLTKGEFSLVEAEGSPIGAIALAETEECVFIVEMQIAPDWQKRGIGAALLIAVIGLARTRGKPAALQVLRENRARLLYQRHGFRTTSETATHYCMTRQDTVVSTG